MILIKLIYPVAEFWDNAIETFTPVTIGVVAASHGCTVVEHSTHNSQSEGSNPATSTGRELLGLAEYGCCQRL
jgi:hypothetical protein